MKNLPLLFAGIFFALAFSFTGLILSSIIQFGRLQPVALEAGGIPKPEAPVGLAAQGKLVYIDLGCVYCHSQQVRRKGYGADFERGWGDRATVARDYITQDRVLLGTMRTGPDLMTVGQRIPTSDWHHQHLYNPQFTSKGSIMPPYRFLYEIRPVGDTPHPNAVTVPRGEEYDADRPPEGFEIVPTRRADALVAYLLSLKVDYELPESKFAQ